MNTLARRANQLAPLLLVGAVEIHRSVFLLTRDVPKGPDTVPVPLPMQLSFGIGGAVVILFAALRVARLVPRDWIVGVAVAAMSPYVFYSWWLMDHHPYFRIGGVVGEFLLIPTLVAWTWGSHPVRYVDDES